MGLLSHSVRCGSRGWGRICATVAAFALAAAVLLSFAPAAGAFERFGSPVQISGDSLTALTLGDFGGTGREDIAAISTGVVEWFRGEGGGAFAPPVVSLVDASDALSDIATLPNPDGADYAAISDERNDSIDIGFLTQTGFVQVQQLSLESDGCIPLQIAVGDFTGEAGGSDDFAVRCATPTADLSAVMVVLAAPPATPGGNPTWAVSQTFFPIPGFVTSIATVADNAAGGVDIVVTGAPSLSSTSQAYLVTYVPSGAPGHYEPSGLTMSSQAFPTAIATATIAGDPAVIVGSFAEPSTPPLDDYPGNSIGTFTRGLMLPTSSGIIRPTALAAGLFNNDAFTDLAVAELTSDGCDVTIDTGEGQSAIHRFGVFGAGATLATCDFVSDMQVGDLNGEGRDDIAYVDPYVGLFVLYQDPPVLLAQTPVTVVTTLPVASDVGLLIQRRGKPRRVAAEVPTPTGTQRVTREVPTLIKVGKIPLGPHHKGRNTIHYKLLVNGHPLAPGSYIVTLRSLNSKHQVLDLSQPVALTVNRHGRAHFGKHVLI